MQRQNRIDALMSLGVDGIAVSPIDAEAMTDLLNDNLLQRPS